MEEPTINQVTNTDGGGTNTVLIVLVIIILLVGGYFLFLRGDGAMTAEEQNDSINVDINLPEGGASGEGSMN